MPPGQLDSKLVSSNKHNQGNTAIDCWSESFFRCSHHQRKTCISFTFKVLMIPFSYCIPCVFPSIFLLWLHFFCFTISHLQSHKGFPGDLDKKIAGNGRDLTSIPGLGSFPGGGHDNPLQYSCLENPMDRGVQQATVYGVAKSQIQLSDCFQSGAFGKETACQCRRQKRCKFNRYVRKIPWRREWQPIPVLLPGKSQGQRRLAGYSLWGHKRFGHDLETKQ